MSTTTTTDLSKARRALKKTYATQYALDAQRDSLRTLIRTLETAGEAEAAPKPAKKRARPEEEDAEWSCKGNVVAGTACATPEAGPAANTRWEKKTFQTCVMCKKAINKSRRGLKEQRVPVEDDGEDLGAPLQMEPEEDA